MEQRQLGQTKISVTPIGLGLAALGRPGYINLGHAQDLQHEYAVSVMEQHAHDVLDAAWAAGIRYFDAARSYGRAEAFLASWLHSRRIDKEHVTVGSKWGYTYTAGWQVQAEKHEVKEHSLPVLQRQIRESRALLGPYLDLYQIHSATLDSGVLENDAVLAELARLRAGGLAIGLSLSGPGQAQTLEEALAVRIDGERLFDSVQATWNILEPSAEPVLQTAHAAGMGVIIKEAVANGRLTPRNDHPEFREKRAVLENLATTRHTTIDALALAAVLAQPWADVVLSGAAKIAHVDANVQALAVEWDAELGEQTAGLAESPATYWHIRSQLSWN